MKNIKTEYLFMGGIGLLLVVLVVYYMHEKKRVKTQSFTSVQGRPFNGVIPVRNGATASATQPPLSS